jgi:hypothetical protein
MDPYIGRVVQNYRIVSVIGAGGMGKVYRAEQVKLKRPVCLKTLLPHLSGMAEDAVQADRAFESQGVEEPLSVARRLASVAQPGRPLATRAVQKPTAQKVAWTERPSPTGDDVGPLFEASELKERWAALEPMVGRATEVEHLNKLLDQVAESRPGGFLFVGGTGLGKSRLLEAAAQQAQARGVTVARARGGRFSGASALDVVRQRRDTGCGDVRVMRLVQLQQQQPGGSPAAQLAKRGVDAGALVVAQVSARQQGAHGFHGRRVLQLHHQLEQPCAHHLVFVGEVAGQHVAGEARSARSTVSARALALERRATWPLKSAPSDGAMTLKASSASGELPSVASSVLSRGSRKAGETKNVFKAASSFTRVWPICESSRASEMSAWYASRQGRKTPRSARSLKTSTRRPKKASRSAPCDNTAALSSARAPRVTAPCRGSMPSAKFSRAVMERFKDASFASC